MEHTLLECDAPGQAMIWQLSGNLWKDKKSKWIAPDFGTILSCGLIKITDTKGKYRKEDSRLYRIIVSESAHLIWKMRCDRVINGKNNFSEHEIESRWRRTIQNRLELDCLLASNKFSKGQLSQRTLEKTWFEVLADKDSLPECWYGEDGVLVGIRSGEG